MHLGSTFQQTGVQVKHISRVSLTTRRTTEQQRHLTVGNSLLRKIIVEDHSMLSVVTEVLTHSGSSVRSKELQRSGIGRSGGNNDAVLHGFLLVKLSDQLSDSGSLLSNSHVDTGKRLLLGLLVNDGINGDGSLSSLTITNDKLTLSTSDRDQGINSLQARKHRFGDRLSGDDSRRLDLGTRTLAVVKRRASVDRLSNSVNDTSQKLFADGNIHDSSRSLHGVSLENITIITKDHNSDVVLFQVQCHTTKPGREHNHLSCLDIGKSVDTGNTVSNRNYCSCFSVFCDIVTSSCSTNLALEVC
mmetsp:Transcript_2822/g.4822  ORF Transcript_2822/g.4822 Transcript_2822/m.4822 type:complete len:302 (-) Transcript_2822:159-1064(-)